MSVSWRAAKIRVRCILRGTRKEKMVVTSHVRLPEPAVIQHPNRIYTTDHINERTNEHEHSLLFVRSRFLVGSFVRVREREELFVRSARVRLPRGARDSVANPYQKREDAVGSRFYLTRVRPDSGRRTYPLASCQQKPITVRESSKVRASCRATSSANHAI